MSNIKPCPVKRELFEECCWKTALFLFEEDWTWRDKYDPDEELRFDLHPDEAAAVCELSPPTFRLRAKQFLYPEKFGELSDEFFNGTAKYKPRPIKEGSYNAAGHERYLAARKAIDAQKAEIERLRIKDASELPTL